MATMGISQFKAQALKLLNRVAKTKNRSPYPFYHIVQLYCLNFSIMIPLIK